MTTRSITTPRQAAIILFFLSISLLAASCLPGTTASAYTEKSFAVGVNEKHTIAVELKAGQTIEGNFSVSGKEDSIDFYIKDAFGGLTYGVVRAEGSHKFVAQAKYSSIHTIYFDNSFAFGESRQIALRYRIR